MKQIDCTDPEFSAALMLIRVMRSGHSPVFEYDGEQRLIHIHSRHCKNPWIDSASADHTTEMNVLFNKLQEQ